MPAPIANLAYQNKAAIYGLLANGNRKASLAAARELSGRVLPSQGTADDADADHNRSCFVCWHCGASKIVVETFARCQGRSKVPVYADPFGPDWSCLVKILLPVDGSEAALDAVSVGGGAQVWWDHRSKGNMILHQPLLRSRLAFCGHGCLPLHERRAP